MYCTKCGSVLEQGRCPNCDFVDDTIPVAAGRPKRSKKPKQPKPPKEKKPKQPKQSKQPGQQKEKQPLTRKKKVNIIVSAAAFLVVCGAGAFLAVYFVRNAKYNDAIDLMRRENLEAAADSFEELGNFKNAPDFLEETLIMIDYFDAIDAFEDGDYEDAISMFADLNGYEDSREREDLAQQHFDYEEAKALFDAGAFEQAKVAYLALGNFEDSIAMVELCQVVIDYEEAQTLFATEQYLQAKNIFDTILEFGDSSDMSFICECVLTFNEAVDKVDGLKFSSAESMLKGLRKDINSSTVDISAVLSSAEISYYLGKAYYGQELFYSAYTEFKRAGTYNNAAYMAGTCKKPIETEEVYENPDYDRNSIKFTTYAPKEGGYSACVKVYTESRVLISTYVIAYKEKLKIYLPKGTFYFDVSYGKEWFGEKEAFGTGFERTGPDKLKSGYYYTWEL